MAIKASDLIKKLDDNFEVAEKNLDETLLNCASRLANNSINVEVENICNPIDIITIDRIIKVYTENGFNIRTQYVKKYDYHGDAYEVLCFVISIK